MTLTLHPSKPRPETKQQKELEEVVLPDLPKKHEGPAFTEEELNKYIEQLDSNRFSTRREGSLGLAKALLEISDAKNLYELNTFIDKNIDLFRTRDSSPERTERLEAIDKLVKTKATKMLIDDAKSKKLGLRFGEDNLADLIETPDEEHTQIKRVPYDPSRDPHLGLLALELTDDMSVKETLIRNLEDHADAIGQELLKYMSADKNDFSKAVFDVLAKSNDPAVKNSAKEFVMEQMKDLTPESFRDWAKVCSSLDVDAGFDIAMKAKASGEQELIDTADSFLMYEYIYEDKYRDEVIEIVKSKNDPKLLARKLQYGSNDSKQDQKNRLEFLSDSSVPIETRLGLINDLTGWVRNNHSAESQFQTVISALELGIPEITSAALAGLGAWANEREENRSLYSPERVEGIDSMKKRIFPIAEKFLNDKNPEIRSKAIELYTEMRPEHLEKKLSPFLSDTSENVRLIAAISLVKNGSSEKAIETLHSLLESKDPTTQLQSLEQLVNKDAVNQTQALQLLKSIENNDDTIIVKKAAILGQIKSEQSVSQLLELESNTSNERTLADIARSIGMQGAMAEKALPYLRQIAEKNKNSGYSLVYSQAVKNVVIGLLDAGQTEHRLEGARLLAESILIDDATEDRVVELVSKVDNSSEEIIMEKAHILGRVRSEAATELLFELLKLEDSPKSAEKILSSILSQEPVDKKHIQALKGITEKYPGNNLISNYSNTLERISLENSIGR